ncbi:hypothetical protein [Bordetella genomosp. 9]|uniref:hypothetical protein n=1 Tax=Bordetella genomosp. 9 TaxID=1416803 RepID=UPI000B9E22AF|nr:hypothetical protein [Bordetella genomosp. 9]
MVFIWEGNKGFSLWDEGYLWYGVQRVVAGEVPVRDFMAYDPGRYYWAAALLMPWGDYGIMAVRAACAVFEALGLFAGLYLVSREIQASRKSVVFCTILTGITLVSWMCIRHKLFDTSISIFSVGMVVYLLERPVGRRYLLAGVYTGMAAVFGRNHGVYAAFGMLIGIAWLATGAIGVQAVLRGLATWAAGVVLGFSPILLMCLFAPGFATAFVDSVRFMFEVKGTNLPLPVPWPWDVQFSSIDAGAAVRQLIAGLGFIAIVAYGLIGVAWAFFKRRGAGQVHAITVACAGLSLAYSHYAYSRADFSHLTLSVFPLLLGVTAVICKASGWMRWLSLSILAVASVWVNLPYHPGWQCERAQNCVAVEVSGSSLIMDPGTASDVVLLRRLAEQYAPGGRSIFATPFWPGAYAVLERKSPIWEIYALFPRSADYQRQQIRELKAAAPGIVVINNLALDGRAELRFSNTHALVYQYVLDNFDRIEVSPNPDYLLFRAKDAGSH